MAYRWILLCAPAVASTFLPVELKALSPGGGRIGVTSSASIRIEASVAPRMGIRGPASLRSDRGAGSASSFCIWSSSPLRRYTVTLSGLAHNKRLEPVGAVGKKIATPVTSDASSMRLAEGRPLSAIARSSIMECNKPGSDVSLALDVPGGEMPSTGPALLILAPE
jgi:hypothetical protein